MEQEGEEEEDEGGEQQAFCSSGGVFRSVLDWEAPPSEACRGGGLLRAFEEGARGVTGVWDVQSSERKEASGVLQLLSTVWESGVDCRVSWQGGSESGGVRGGDEGTAMLVDEDEGVEAGRQGGGLQDLEPTTIPDWTSSPDMPQPPMRLRPTPSSASPHLPFSLTSLPFFPRFRLGLAAEEEEGDEAEEEEVEVVELGLAFLGLRIDSWEEEGEGEARVPRLFILPMSLLLPEIAMGSEQGLRKGDLLSLSLRNTTAMEPPTTPPLPPPAWTECSLPTPPRTPSFPTPPSTPVVLLTPSRTSIDTLDCSFFFLLLPERPPSFLPFSLSFPDFRRFLAGKGVGWGVTGRTGEEGGGEREEWSLPVLVLKGGSGGSASLSWDFFLAYLPLWNLGMCLGLG